MKCLTHRFCFLNLLILSLLGVAAAQPSLSWRELESVSIAYEQDSLHNLWRMTASFPPELQQWDGQIVRIHGYALPTSVTSGHFVLSAYPFASCFFCGGAGPESVIELHLARKTAFKTDEYVTIEGKLRLLMHSEMFLYTLENARRVP